MSPLGWSGRSSSARPGSRCRRSPCTGGPDRRCRDSRIDHRVPVDRRRSRGAAHPRIGGGASISGHSAMVASSASAKSRQQQLDQRDHQRRRARRPGVGGRRDRVTAEPTMRCPAAARAVMGRRLITPPRPAAGRARAGCRSAGPPDRQRTALVIGRARAFIACSASAASASGAMVRGEAVMIAPPAGQQVRSHVTAQVAVGDDADQPAVHRCTPRQPNRFSVITSRAWCIGVSGAASGMRRRRASGRAPP